MSLALAHWDGRHFSPQEHRVAAAVAAAFERWSQGLAGWQEPGGERRSASRFEQEVDEFNANALARGVATTTIVVRGSAALEKGLTQRWVSGLRMQMRASDPVGATGDGEVVVLLQDATAEQVDRTVARVTAIVTATPGDGSVSVGVCTRRPGDQAPGAVNEARRRASDRRINPKQSSGEARV